MRLLVALCLLTQESGLLAERAERLVWAVGRLLIRLTNLRLLLLGLLLGLLTLRLLTLRTNGAVEVVSAIELVLRLLQAMFRSLGLSRSLLLLEVLVSVHLLLKCLVRSGGGESRLLGGLLLVERS